MERWRGGRIEGRRDRVVTCGRGILLLRGNGRVVVNKGVRILIVCVVEMLAPYYCTHTHHFYTNTC